MDSCICLFPLSFLLRVQFNNEMEESGQKRRQLDSTIWTLLNATAFPAREAQTSVSVGNSSIAIIGGQGNSILNDVWLSVNTGGSWKLLTSNAWGSNGGRAGHSSVVVGNNIITMGGTGSNYGYLNDVWISVDGGSNWKLQTSAAWGSNGGRAGHSSVVVGNSIITMGGYNGTSVKLNDVWLSVNSGGNWTLQTSAAWGLNGGREAHTSVVVGNSIITMGGGGNNGGNKVYLNEVWLSNDSGVSWSLQTSAAWGSNGKMYHASVVVGNKIVTLGGLGGSGPHENDVWFSVDWGVSWTLQTTAAQWSGRFGLTSLFVGDSIVIMGGGNGVPLSDVWALPATALTVTSEISLSVTTIIIGAVVFVLLFILAIFFFYLCEKRRMKQILASKLMKKATIVQMENKNSSSSTPSSLVSPKPESTFVDNPFLVVAFKEKQEKEEKFFKVKKEEEDENKEKERALNAKAKRDEEDRSARFKESKDKEERVKREEDERITKESEKLTSAKKSEEERVRIEESKEEKALNEAGWKTLYDESTKKKYFYNEFKGETSWEKPNLAPLEIKDNKEKVRRAASVEEFTDDQVKESEVFKFLTDKVNVKHSNAIKYSRSILLDGYDTMKSIINSKKFDISKYIDKEGKCSEFQIQIEDFKVENKSYGSHTSSSPKHGSSPIAKVVQLSVSLAKGQVSGGRSVVLDGLFTDGKKFVNKKVKVKLLKYTHTTEIAISNEFDVADALNEISSSCFIKVFAVLYGSEKQIIPFHGSEDILTGYIALVMERGIVDVDKYLKSKVFDFIEKRAIGKTVCNILVKAHSAKFVLMDFKSKNLVRILDSETSEIITKAIDFENTVKEGTEITSFLGTPRYTSPEVAKFLINKASSIKAQSSMDVFALGLMIWEIINDGNSLWEALGLNVEKDLEVLKCAASLTDVAVQEAINKNFVGDILDSTRSWLQDALKVRPSERKSAEYLLNQHSLFGNVKATLDLSATLKSMDMKLDNIQKSINSLIVMVKTFHSVLGFPCTFIIVPREDEKESKSFFSLSGMKSRLAHTKDAVLKSTKMLCQVTIVFICDGCELDSKTKCSRFHKGFNCDLPGENLRAMAPALIIMAKTLTLAMQIGKIATGIHIPTDIPGASQLMSLLDGYGDLVSFPLNPEELSLYHNLVGLSAHPSSIPTQADLINAMATNLGSCGKEIQDKIKSFIKSGYSEAKIWLDKSNPKWIDEKEKYDLRRYTKEAEVLWLCDAHAKNIKGITKFENKFEKGV